MATVFERYIKGINLDPSASANNGAQGDLEVLSSTGKLYYHNGATSVPLITTTSTDTLTNKSIDGNNNTLTNIPLSAGTGVVPLVNGGTGVAAASANAAFNALSPMTTGGDIIYGGASGVATRLANGSSGQVLLSNGGTAAPSWGTVLTNPMTTGGDIIYGGSSGAPTRLANGTAGQLLQSNGTTTAPTWVTIAPPTGSIVMWTTSSAPTGWVLTDGSAISRTTFAALFAVIGTTYGVGNGTTTFNVPNTQGIFIRGVGSQTIGGISHTGVNATITGDTYQGHFHSVSDPGHNHGAVTSGASNDHTHNVTTNNAGALGSGVPANSDNGGIGASSTTSGQSADHYHGISNGTTGLTVTSGTTDGSHGTPRVGSETAPANIGLYYIIKT